MIMNTDMNAEDWKALPLVHHIMPPPPLCNNLQTRKLLQRSLDGGTMAVMDAVIEKERSRLSKYHALWGLRKALLGL